MDFKAVSEIKLSKDDGLIVLVLAVLLGAWGTVYAGFKAGGEVATKAYIIALIQWLTTWFFFIGYLWAVYTAWKIYNNSK